MQQIERLVGLVDVVGTIDERESGGCFYIVFPTPDIVDFPYYLRVESLEDVSPPVLQVGIGDNAEFDEAWLPFLTHLDDSFLEYCQSKALEILNGR